MGLIFLTTFNSYSTDKSHISDNSAERINRFPVTIACSDKNGMIDVSFFNPFGTFVSLLESYNGTGILRKRSLIVIESESYKQHYTEWVKAERLKVNYFERSDSIKNIFLAPYSKRSFEFRYDNLSRFNSNKEYILYFRSSAYVTINYATNLKILTSNQLRLIGGKCI
jgi:hypothetical protein